MENLDARFRNLGVDTDREPRAYFDVRGSKFYRRFQNQKCLGRFRITKEKNYTTSDVDIPLLIPRNKIKSVKGTKLETDIDKASLIECYKNYHELKQKFFLKWIIENCHLISKRPHFICFGGRIAYPMMTPEAGRYGDWDMLAAKFHDSVYLWHEKMAEDLRDRESYYGVYFEHLLTHENPEDEPPNEFDKVFVVNEITFGSHQLLCLNEIDAVDERGSWVEIKVSKKCHPRRRSEKELSYWAQSCVPGVKLLVLGTRDDQGVVTEVEEKWVDDLTRAPNWNPASCLEFEDNLLTWINSLFTENNPNIVKKISWTCGSRRVESSDVEEKHIPKAMLPEWYVEALTLQDKGGPFCPK